MSTIKDFESAPFGATATDPRGRRAVKTFNERNPWRQDVDKWTSCSFSEEKLVESGFTLDPVPAPAPTTAREALDLAWELAHPVKEGQTIPAGMTFFARYSGGSTGIFTPVVDHNGPPNNSLCRTLDPLPDPEPDWLDAPAVKARVKGYPVLFTWIPVDGPRHHRWHSPVKGEGETFDWQDLTDVTPLYPKEGN